MMGEKETSSADLAKLYQGGATLAKTAAETGLGRFAVAYRLEKAGVERRNPGSPRKTAEEKGAFAKQRLKEIFGDSWPAVANDLEAGKVSARKLAIANGVSHSNLLSQLKRAGIEIPKKKQKQQKFASDPPPMVVPREIMIFDLVNPDDDWRVTGRILKRFAKLNLSSQKVAVASDQDLIKLGFTDEEILYMREQLRKSHGIDSCKP